MNEQFIEGFVKKAIEKGFNDQTIANLFKLAIGQPDPNAKPNQMFNTLPQISPNGVQPQHQEIKATLQRMMTNPQQANQLKQLLGVV